MNSLAWLPQTPAVPQKPMQQSKQHPKPWGGRFFAVSCGNWLEGPEVGQLARVLVQAVLVVVLEPEPGVPTRYAITQDRVVTPVAVHAVAQPQDHPQAMITYVVYPLNSNGWPTGRVERAGAKGCAGAAVHRSINSSTCMHHPCQLLLSWIPG